MLNNILIFLFIFEIVKNILYYTFYIKNHISHDKHVISNYHLIKIYYKIII